MNKIHTATHDETFKSNKRRGCMKDLTEQGPWAFDNAIKMSPWEKSFCHKVEAQFEICLIARDITCSEKVIPAYASTIVSNENYVCSHSKLNTH
jgi:hypothetical protein